MASDTAQPGKPTVIYNPLRLNWKNVVAGTVIALLMVAIGVFSFTYYNPDATPVPPVVIKSGTQSAKTSKATPSAEKAVTADWKTYTGTTQYQNFSIQYPEDWEIYASAPGYDLKNSWTLAFRPIGSKIVVPVGLNIYKNNNNIIEKAAKDVSWTEKITENVTVDGAKGIKVTGRNSLGEKNSTVVFSTSNYIYKIESAGVYMEIQDQILSTFKFLD